MKAQNNFDREPLMKPHDTLQNQPTLKEDGIPAMTAPSLYEDTRLIKETMPQASLHEAPVALSIFDDCEDDYRITIYRLVEQPRRSKSPAKTTGGGIMIHNVNKDRVECVKGRATAS